PPQPIKQLTAYGSTQINVWSFVGVAGYTALNYGPKNNQTIKFAANPPSMPPQMAFGSSIYSNWEWGPSSEHAGGAVLHCWADAHVSPIQEDIDVNIYMQLYTR